MFQRFIVPMFWFGMELHKEYYGASSHFLSDTQAHVGQSLHVSANFNPWQCIQSVTGLPALAQDNMYGYRQKMVITDGTLRQI
jgi:hypothetical protein